MAKVHVLVVDDSFFMRKVIIDILVADPEIEVVGQASDGLMALEMIEQLRPDVVSLDIEMPKQNGLDTLKQIMALPAPPPTVIVSGYAQKGADLTLKCLSAGAIDIVLKPGGSISFEMDKIETELRKKIKLAAQVDTQKVKRLVSTKSRGGPTLPKSAQSNGGVLIIGSSTGGPAALEVVLPQIPEHFPHPVVVAQHLPSNFLPYFIQRLGALSHLPVVEATNGLSLSPGTIYVAKGGTLTQIVAKAHGSCFSVEPDPSNFESPSVSALLKSAAALYKDKTTGVILTGMGSDGLAGAKSVKQEKGTILVQNEATSVVYGMPRQISEAHLADKELSLDKLIPEVLEILAYE